MRRRIVLADATIEDEVAEPGVPEVALAETDAAGRPADSNSVSASAAGATRGWRRMAGLGGAQTAFTASLLLMGSSLLSGALSLLRQTLVAKYFGAGTESAAYTAAFQLPDMILYLLIGGVASSAFVTILSRYTGGASQAKDERAGDEALSAILNVMFAVLLGAVLLGEVCAPLYVHLFLRKLDAETAALCVHLTRILLLGPLFFFTGGVFGARLLVRRVFWYQALAPVFYSGGIVLGAWLLHGRFGIDSLAIGAMAGAFAGPLLLNVLGARRAGMQWTPVWNVRHPALRQWVVLSLPLMLGQSLTTTDTWIRNFLISGDKADLVRLNFARQLFTAPMSVLGPAAGIASLPFFAALWVKGDVAAFSGAVDRAVSRMIAVSLVAAGWMLATAPLLVELLLRTGKFTAGDASLTTRYFGVYTLGLFLWTSQNLYARAFYGAGNTLTPMLSGTVVTAVSIPLYWWLHRALGPEGLAWAATLGMLLHTGALAILLHTKRMVSVAGLEFGELGRSAVASAAGAAAVWCARWLLPTPAGRGQSLLLILGVSAVWALVVFWILRATGSRLMDAVLRRRAA